MGSHLYAFDLLRHATRFVALVAIVTTTKGRDAGTQAYGWIQQDYGRSHDFIPRVRVHVVHVDQLALNLWF